MSEKMPRDIELKLHGLRAIADTHARALEDIAKTVADLVGLGDDESGWASDFVYDPKITPAVLWGATRNQLSETEE